MRVCQFRHSGTIGSSTIGWIGSNIQCTKGDADDQTGLSIEFEGEGTDLSFHSATNLEKRTGAKEFA
jgi:hypothetical protein